MTAVDSFPGIESNFSAEPDEDFNENKAASEIINNNVSSSSNLGGSPLSDISNISELVIDKPPNSDPNNISIDDITIRPSRVLEHGTNDVDTKFSEKLLESENSNLVPNEVNNALNSSVTSETDAVETNGEPENDEWLDIIGSGDFKKKIIIPGAGPDTRPGRGDMLSVNITTWIGEDIIEKHENLDIILGDMDVIQGLELVLSLMEKGEKSIVLIPSRLAYGKIGRLPDVPPECDLKSEVELIEAKQIDSAELSLPKRLQLGEKKRNRGNFFYERAEYLNAIHCYERAAEYLDMVQNNLEDSPEELQKILDVRIKIYNNLAATHLKLEAYDAALKSVEFVLKIQPNNMKAQFRKGKVLAAKGMTDEAIIAMRMASRLDPDLKVVQQEISRLVNRKKQEENAQKAMYQRMFKQSNKAPPPKASWVRKWSMVAGGMAALAFSLVAYRQYHS